MKVQVFFPPPAIRGLSSSLQCIFAALIMLFCSAGAARAQNAVKIGFNCPRTGPYKAIGTDMQHGAELAYAEINAGGGILGKQLQLVILDTGAKAEKAAANVEEMIEKEKVAMVLGSVTSSEALAVSDLCQKKGILYMATIAGTPLLTGADAHRYTFRTGYDSWMDTKALAIFLNEHFSDKKYFYISYDNPLGQVIEADLRRFTGTEDTAVHKRALTSFPVAKESDFRRAFTAAAQEKPDILVLIQVGQNISAGIIQASLMGIKSQMQIVVPFLELNTSEGIPPKILEGIIGTTDWAWEIPYRYGYQRGKAFVEAYTIKYQRYPSWGAATAYTALYQYKDAAERAGSLDAPAVIKALEGHSFTLLKNKQTWRAFDHQCVQSVYIVRGKPEADVQKDRYRLDFVEILNSIPGDHLVRTRDEWNSLRTEAGKPPALELLPGEEAAAPSVPEAPPAVPAAGL